MWQLRGIALCNDHRNFLETALEFLKHEMGFYLNSPGEVWGKHLPLTSCTWMETEESGGSHWSYLFQMSAFVCCWSHTRLWPNKSASLKRENTKRLEVWSFMWLWWSLTKTGRQPSSDVCTNCKLWKSPGMGTPKQNQRKLPVSKKITSTLGKINKSLSQRCSPTAPGQTYVDFLHQFCSLVFKDVQALSSNTFSPINNGKDSLPVTCVFAETFACLGVVVDFQREVKWGLSFRRRRSMYGFETLLCRNFAF